MSELPADQPRENADVDAEDIAARKQAIRSELRAALRALREHPVGLGERSAAIVERLRGIVAAQPDVTNVMVYRALPSEPRLDAFAEWCAHRGIGVLAPRVVGVELEPENYAAGGDDRDIAVTELDLVIVPGLGFTAAGARLGRGGGHFDRFLPRLRPGCLTVGVCFAEQLVAELPTEPHDVAVATVVVG